MHRTALSLPALFALLAPGTAALAQQVGPPNGSLVVVGGAMRDRGIIGVDNLLWGSDYPHLESTFPRSREILDRVMAEVGEEERDRMTRRNTARLYGF